MASSLEKAQRLGMEVKVMEDDFQALTEEVKKDRKNETLRKRYNAMETELFNKRTEGRLAEMAAGIRSEGTGVGGDAIKESR